MAPLRIRSKMAGAVVTGGLALVQEAPGRRKEPDAIVVEHRSVEDDDDRIVLYFHPEVPEATLVLVRL